MISKEFISYLKEQYKCKETLEKSNAISYEFADILEGIVSIEKDLEVLEIFDRLFHRRYNNKKIISLIDKLDHSTITFNDYNLIKEWLEND